MWRRQAVEMLLVEEIAGAPRRDAGSAAAGDGKQRLESLQAASRRALLVAGLDWLAIAVLFFLRSGDHPWLSVGAGVETVFTFGILAVATHSGFRLGQLEKLRAVRRALKELEARVDGC